MKFDRRHVPLAVTIAIVGVVLPFLSWGYAKAIDEHLVFEEFPDPIPRFQRRRLRRSRWRRALLSARRRGRRPSRARRDLHPASHGYWQSDSSTTPLLFLFYLPWAFIAAALGVATGYACGKVHDRAPLVGRALTAILLLVYVAVNLRWANYGRFNLPAEVAVVESRASGLALVKTPFFTTEERLGALTSIERRTCSVDPEATLTLTGRGGTAFVTETGDLRGFVKFEDVADFDVFSVDVEGDGICEFADRAGGWQPVGLIDSGGRYVFRYGKNMTSRRPERLVEIEHSPQDFIPFDLEGDGTLELLVPLLVVGGDETHVLDATGARIRTLSENLEGSRALEGKLYGPARGELLVRDADLSIVGKLPLGRGTPCRVSCGGPAPPAPWYLAILDGKRLRVLGLEDGAEKTSIPGVTGEAFAFLGERVVIADAENRRQFLRVVDGAGRKLYEEVLEPGGALFASSNDNFLISECTEERCPAVWRYRLP